MKALLGLAVLAAALLLAGLLARDGGGTASGGREAVSPPPAGQAQAVFAGGCFWCMEGPFDKVPGVISTTVGYTGGHTENPTYEEVSSGTTGHQESIRVLYDPAKVTYAELLDVFWHNVDPLDSGGQFCDRGSQYRSAIFYDGPEQERLAEESKSHLAASGRFDRPIATEIRPLGPFYPAEEYHQDFYRKNPVRYRFYRSGCGRDRRLEEVWGPGGAH